MTGKSSASAAVLIRAVYQICVSLQKSKGDACTEIDQNLREIGSELLPNYVSFLSYISTNKFLSSSGIPVDIQYFPKVLQQFECFSSSLGKWIKVNSAPSHSPFSVINTVSETISASLLKLSSLFRELLFLVRNMPILADPSCFSSLQTVYSCPSTSAASCSSLVHASASSGPSSPSSSSMFCESNLLCLCIEMYVHHSSLLSMLAQSQFLKQQQQEQDLTPVLLFVRAQSLLEEAQIQLVVLTTTPSVSAPTRLSSLSFIPSSSTLSVGAKAQLRITAAWLFLAESLLSMLPSSLSSLLSSCPEIGRSVV